MHRLWMLVSIMLVAFPAYAQEEDTADATTSAKAPEHCGWGAALAVSFTINKSTFSGAKAELDTIIQKIDAYAAQQHIGKLTVQGVHYNFSPQRNVLENAESINSYTLQGSVSYHLTAADDAFTFAEFLAKKQFHVGVTIRQPCAKPTTK